MASEIKSEGKFIAILDDEDSTMATVEVLSDGKVKISMDDTYVCLPVKTWIKLAQDQFKPRPQVESCKTLGHKQGVLKRSPYTVYTHWSNCERCGSRQEYYLDALNPEHQKYFMRDYEPDLAPAAKGRE